MLRNIVVTIFALVWAAVLVLVGGRFLALLADANRSSEIVDRLYRHSDFWVKPFFGMFDLANKTVENTGGVFEPASLIAFAVYFLAGLLIMGILTANYGFVGTRRHAHDV
jgi:hypothetical protein